MYSLANLAIYPSPGKALRMPSTPSLVLPRPEPRVSSMVSSLWSRQAFLQFSAMHPPVKATIKSSSFA